MAEAVSAVRFDITAETAKLQEGVKKAQAILRSLQGSAKGIESSINGLGNRLTAAFAADRLVEFASHAVQAGAAIKQFSDQAGLTTDQFQELQYALRGTGGDGERLATAFATFGRNLSDLQRNTGQLYEGLRRIAPAFVEQLKGAKDTSEAFDALVGFISTLTSKHDQLRIAQMAGGEQMVKIAVDAARLGPAFDQARQAAHDTGNVLSGEHVNALKTSQQAWSDFANSITIATAGIAAFLAQGMLNAQKAADQAKILSERIQTLGRDSVDASIRVGRLPPTLAELARGIREINNTPTNLPTDPLKGMQAQLQLLQSRLQAMPPAAFQMSAAYQAAFGQMAAVINATASAEERGALLGAAANNARVQAYQAYVSAMGIALPLEDQHQQRLALINLAIEDQAAKQRAVNAANFEYQQQQLMQLQSLGLELTANEQRRQSLERIKLSLGEGEEAARRYQRAMEVASRMSSIEFAEGLATIGSALQAAFPEQKAFAVANAIMNIAVAMSKALAMEGPLGWAEYAKIAAAGVALLGSIRSATISGGGGKSMPSVGGGSSSGPAEAPQVAQSQSLTISLPAGRYTHQEIESIISGINDRVQNGVTLISTKIQ